MKEKKDIYYYLSKNICPYCKGQIIKDAITGEIYCSKCGIIYDSEDYYDAFDVAEREILEKEKDLIFTIPKKFYFNLSKGTKDRINNKKTIKRNYEYSKNWLKSIILSKRIVSNEMLDLILLDYKKFYYNKSFFGQKRKKQIEYFASAYLYIKAMQYSIPLTPYEIFKEINDKKHTLQNFINYIKIFADYFDIDLNKIDKTKLLKNYILRFYNILNNSNYKSDINSFINNIKIENNYSIFELPSIALNKLDKLKSFTKIDKKKLKNIIP